MTKFATLTLRSKVELVMRPTIFKEVLAYERTGYGKRNKKIVEAKGRPEEYDNITAIHLWAQETMFLAWNNSDSGIVIYFGTKGDEFDQ